MIYRAMANRTKTDGKWVVVCISLFPINVSRLREYLMMKSLEFDELTQIEVKRTEEELL